jgi:hypothetical protein
MKDTARALSLALDRDVGKLHAVLETLAASPSLDSRDFKSFNELALRATEQPRVPGLSSSTARASRS